MIKNGGNTFAFFTRNPRGGNAKAIDEKDVEKFLQLAKDNNFGKIVEEIPLPFLPGILVEEMPRQLTKKTLKNFFSWQKTTILERLSHMRLIHRIAYVNNDNAMIKGSSGEYRRSLL